MTEEIIEPEVDVEFNEEGIAESINLENTEETPQQFLTYDALPPFEKLKMVSSKIGIRVKGKPYRYCKHCHGEGVVGYTPVKGSKLGIPIACTCVAIERISDDAYMPRLNRVERRKQERMMRKIKNNK